MYCVCVVCRMRENVGDVSSILFFCVPIPFAVCRLWFVTVCAVHCHCLVFLVRNSNSPASIYFAFAVRLFCLFVSIHPSKLSVQTVQSCLFCSVSAVLCVHPLYSGHCCHSALACVVGCVVCVTLQSVDSYS